MNMRSSIQRILVVIALGIIWGWGKGYAKDVVILYTNDVHGYIAPQKDRGFARICAMARSIRSRAEKDGARVLFVVAGDIFQGTLLSHISKGEAEFKALDACGVDAVVVGNHDFDYGLDRLVTLSKEVHFPVISANIRWKKTKKRVFRSGITKDEIQIVGVTTTKTPVMTAGWTDMKKIIFTGPYKEIKRVITDKDKLKIVLSHLGYPEDIKLAKRLPWPAIIIGGHTHTLLKQCEKVKDALVCQAGSYSRYLGVLRVAVGRDGSYKIKENRVMPVADSHVKADKKVMRAVDRWLRKAQELGRSVIAHMSVDFDGNPRAMHMQEMPLGDLVCDAAMDKVKAQAGFINAGVIRASIKKGPITYSEVFRILPFNDSLVVYKIKGRMLKKILQHAAYQKGSNGFLQVCGMRIFADVKGRIKKVLINNKPLYPDRVYRIVTLDFLANGGDGYRILRTLKGKWTGISIRKAFIDYIKRFSRVRNPAQGRWIFDGRL